MNNVTLIDDLPNLDDLEPNNTHINSGLSMIPSSEVNKYQKFIRNSGMKTPIESGMQINKPTQKPIVMNKIFEDPQEYDFPGKYKPYIPATYENFEQLSSRKKNIEDDISCIHVAHHTEHCTVCSKLYSSNNMVFIFIIIFQAVIILLLIKKILE